MSSKRVMASPSESDTVLASWMSRTAATECTATPRLSRWVVTVQRNQRETPGAVSISCSTSSDVWPERSARCAA